MRGVSARHPFLIVLVADDEFACPDQNNQKGKRDYKPGWDEGLLPRNEGFNAYEYQKDLEKYPEDPARIVQETMAEIPDKQAAYSR